MANPSHILLVTYLLSISRWYPQKLFPCFPRSIPPCSNMDLFLSVIKPWCPVDGGLKSWTKRFCWLRRWRSPKKTDVFNEKCSILLKQQKPCLIWYDIIYIYIISYIICDIIFHMYSYVICHIICHNMPYYMSCVICHSLGDIKSQKIQETQPSLRRRGAALGAPETDVIVGWTNIGLIEPTNIY